MSWPHKDKVIMEELDERLENLDMVCLKDWLKYKKGHDVWIDDDKNMLKIDVGGGAVGLNVDHFSVRMILENLSLYEVVDRDDVNDLLEWMGYK